MFVIRLTLKLPIGKSQKIITKEKWCSNEEELLRIYKRLKRHKGNLISDIKTYIVLEQEINLETFGLSTLKKKRKKVVS